MNANFQNPSRRSILRGLGATLALPWMESLAWAEAKATGVKASSLRPPVRYGCLLFANGVNPEHWWARGEGDAMELSKTLQPLAPFRRHLTFVKELHVYNDTSPGHFKLFSNYLSGAKLEEGVLPQGAESLDQVIARHAGKDTPLPSLVLAVEPAESGLRSGVPGIYGSTISWSSATTPIAPEVYPRAVFDRLFDTSSLLRDKSVLDGVLTQAKSFQRKLGAYDRQKLDEFMHGVRDVETRLERAAQERRLEGWRPSLDKPDMERPPDRLPQDVADHMRMMIDLLLLAWQMDKTRVATFLFNRDISHMQFGFLEGVPNEQLHTISHHDERADKLEAYQKINQFHVEQFAYLLERMAAVDEGEGSTLLDNVILQFGSNMFNGQVHDGRNLPMVIAGHGGGNIAGGRVLDVGGLPEERQRACNLYLAIAQAMNVPIKNFGDSVEAFQGLA